MKKETKDLDQYKLLNNMINNLINKNKLEKNNKKTFTL